MIEIFFRNVFSQTFFSLSTVINWFQSEERKKYLFIFSLVGLWIIIEMEKQKCEKQQERRKGEESERNYLMYTVLTMKWLMIKFPGYWFQWVKFSLCNFNVIHLSKCLHGKCEFAKQTISAFWELECFDKV